MKVQECKFWLKDKKLLQYWELKSSQLNENQDPLTIKII